MVALLKDSLYPDEFYASDEAGERVLIQFSPDDVDHHYRRAKEMLAYGLPIPIGWEHQTGAVPMTRPNLEKVLADKTKNICGYITDCLLDHDNHLWFVTEFPDEEDAKQAQKARFVSPEMQENFVDGTNRTWPGSSITHLAITGHPVQIRQGGFRRLSLADYTGKRLRLSVGAKIMAKDDDNLNDENEQTATMEPDGDEGAEGLEGAGGEEGGEGLEGAAGAAPAAPAEPEASNEVETMEEGPEPTAEEPLFPEEEQEGMQDHNLIPELKQIFSAPPFNIVFPDLVDNTQSFLEHLLTGMMTSKAHMAAGGMENREPPEGGEEEMGATAENKGLEEAPNPAVLMSLKRENEALRSQVLKTEKDRLKARIQRISKFIKSDKLKNELNGALGKVRLSVGASGTVDRNELIAKLEVLEEEHIHAPEAQERRKLDKAKKDLATKKTRMSALREQQLPVNKDDGSVLVPEVMERLTNGRWKPTDNGKK